ncbi:hypothetical protein [Kluyvera sichuanensis]|uniref:hypothetical protein n=1 Tax=Kluyvera sichuanensis TaxID=2725494 RepID=UPI0039F519E6
MSIIQYIIFFFFFLNVTLCQATECEIHLSQPVVNYQNISTEDFVSSHGKWSSLDTREIQVSTQCSEPVQIANAFSNLNSGRKFTMGKNSIVEIVASDAYLDGHPVKLGKSTSEESFTLAHSGRQRVLVLAGNTVVPVINGQIPSGQHLEYRLTLKPHINEADLHPEDQNTLDANVFTTVLFQ